MGEVWLASGQSNMEMTFDYCCNTTDSSREEISTANYPHIRIFNVKKNLSIKPLETVKGNWQSAVGERITDFSAAGYFFAKKLHKKLKVPIGIIHSSWGGSRIEAWTSHDVLWMIPIGTFNFLCSFFAKKYPAALKSVILSPTADSQLPFTVSSGFMLKFFFTLNIRICG
jgi:hypothetical protein